VARDFSIDIVIPKDIGSWDAFDDENFKSLMLILKQKRGPFT